MSPFPFKAVCDECHPLHDEDKQWSGPVSSSESIARISVQTHDRRKHGGEKTAEVVEVEKDD